MFESIYPIKTGTLLTSLLFQQATGVDFNQMSHVDNLFPEIEASAHDKRIRVKATSRNRLWKTHVLQKTIEEVCMFLSANPEYLTQARFVHPSKIELTFADGRNEVRRFSELGIDPAELKLSETHASESGNALVVKTRQGETVSIDSAAIRILVDPAYAQKLEAASQKLGIPNAQLEAAAAKGRPSREWYSMEDEKPW